MQQGYGLGSIRACLFISRSGNRRFQMFWTQRVEPYNGLPMLVCTYDVYIPYLCICVCAPRICYARTRARACHMFKSTMFSSYVHPNKCIGRRDHSFVLQARMYRVVISVLPMRRNAWQISPSLCVTSRSMSRAVVLLSTCRATEVAMCRRIARAIA